VEKPEASMAQGKETDWNKQRCIEKQTRTEKVKERWATE
jgi:hypothetical protein